METDLGSRLMKLPTELRLEILAHAVRSARPIAPRVMVPRDAYLLRLPAVTHASHQLRRESLPLYFEENEFYFSVKDVLEMTPDQDLQFERRLLGFGAWCEAAGHANFMRIRRLVLRAFGSLHAPSVSIRLSGRGAVEMEVNCLWQGSGSRRPKAEAKTAPRTLLSIAETASQQNGGRGFLPGDVVVLCREIQRCGADLLYSR